MIPATKTRTRIASALAAAIGIALGTPILAEGMSKGEHATARKNIVSDFRTARIGCEPMLAEVRDVCMADVGGREVVALAELQLAYQPGEASRLALVAARAQAALGLEAAQAAAPKRPQVRYGR